MSNIGNFPFSKSGRYKSLLIALFRKIGGEPLNSLFRDGLHMMLEWSKEKPPSVDDVEFAQAASSVLQFILKNIDNANLEILRDNMVNCDISDQKL